jgi:hypothetical protein
LLSTNAKEYGAQTSEAFTKFLVEKANSDWLKNFNADDWSVRNTGAKGLGAESLKVAEILAHLRTQLRKEKSVSDTVDRLLQGAINKLVEQGYEDNEVWFIVSKNANEEDSAHTNLHFLKVLTAA